MNKINVTLNTHLQKLFTTSLKFLCFNKCEWVVETDQDVTHQINRILKFKHLYNFNKQILLHCFQSSNVTRFAKRVLYMHSFKTHFSLPSVRNINASTALGFTTRKLNSPLSLRPLSQACLASMSVRVAFKWPHLPLASRQPAAIHHTTG